MRPLAVCLAVLLGAALPLAGCGGDDGAETVPGPEVGPGSRLTEPTEATLVLDFVPNAVHTGIYCAQADGLYERANIDLDVVEPSSTADTLRLIQAGEADFGIADGIDVATQAARGGEAQAIMAIVQRPLGGLIALRSSGIGDPSELEGRTVGVTGVPSDGAVLKTMVRDAGGDPAKVKTVTIGFNGPQALMAGRIDAFTGFPIADGVSVEHSGFPVTSFPLDEFGGPSYPGLVVFSTGSRIAADPELMGAFVDATVEGYRATLADPERCLGELLRRVPSLERTVQRAQLDAYLPLFGPRPSAVGRFDPAELERFSEFLLDTGLIEPLPPGRYATDEFLPASGG
jgi:putative hydroxymethylpyrimidine transport system substrate-binding protein